MIEIKTIADFEELIKLEKAIVFIFFEWSGQAHLSKHTVVKWENQTNSAIPFFEINPENLDILSKWVYENDIHGHGYGSVAWLKKGKVLDFEKDAGKFGIPKLEEKISEIFPP